MKNTILLPEPIAREGVKFLEDKGYGVKSCKGTAEDLLVREIHDCHGVITRTARITRRVIEAAPDLKVISKHGVGVDKIDVDFATKRGVRVTNVPQANTNTVAEHTMAMLLALSKNLVTSCGEMKKGNFASRETINAVDLEGKVLGLVGLGHIGSLVARKAALGFGMKVIAFDPFVKKENFGPEIEFVEKRDQVFSNSDFISLHLPATPDTRKSIGTRDFRMMKTSAFLINEARGEIVCEDELVEALKNGEIAGAGLDVFQQEPPSAESEILTLENVLASPHNAAMSVESMIRMAIGAAQSVHEVLSGKRITWPIN